METIPKAKKKLHVHATLLISSFTLHFVELFLTLYQKLISSRYLLLNIRKIVATFSNISWTCFRVISFLTFCNIWCSSLNLILNVTLSLTMNLIWLKSSQQINYLILAIWKTWLRLFIRSFFMETQNLLIIKVPTFWKLL